jgi:outer membrane autotransporter protein
MTVTRRNSGAKFSRVARSLKLSKTAAAVRAGLLTTTAMFALAGANAAFAQTCTPAAPGAGGTTTCSGAFTDSVNNHFTDADSITVILDDTVTVDPAAGVLGIDLSFTGDITLDSSGVFNVDGADAIYVYGQDSATVGVYGDVYNYALNSGDNAVGAYSLGDVSLVVGSAVSTYGDAGTAYAVEMFTDVGNVNIDVQEYASVDATSYSGNALGIWSETNFGGGDITVTNAGDISANTTYGDYSWGTYLYAYGAISVVNTGNISATGDHYVQGTHSWAYHGDAYVYNGAGSISADAANIDSSDYAAATAVYAYAWDAYANVVNAGGDISASAYADNTLYGAYATGVYAYGYLGSLIDNSGTIDATISGYYGYAVGAVAISDNYAEVVNSGTITASSTGYYGSAYGAAAIGYDATVTNTADGYIGAYSYYGSATGAYASGFYATVNNAGDIDATVEYGYAYGAVAYGVYADISNSGNITAYSYYGSAVGAEAIGFASGYVYNDGDIDVSVYIGDAVGAAALSLGYAEVYNTANGSITAYSYYGTATGAQSYGAYSEINNAGDIYASTFVGSAYGAYAAGNYSEVNNSGYIGAYSYYGLAVGAASYGASGAYIYNDGEIYASAYLGTAVGAGAISPVYASVYNTENGSIGAYAYYGTAIGVEVISGDTASVINHGDITASAYIGPYNGAYYAGTGVGVLMNVANYAYLYNSGTITGDGGYYDGGDYSIVSVGTSADYVVNQGTLNGSIDLGYGDDTLYNGADGVINLGNYNFIDMGSSVTVAGNYIYNAGTINFSGNTAIYTSGGTLYNSGALDMQDGSADTYLYFEGNLAGDGSLNVEVDGAAGINDYMYIYGNVDAASTTTINVDLLSLPTAESTVYDIVGVSGDSVAGNFALGAVDFQDNNFLDLEFSLIADIDPTNATPDVFSLGIEVVGLSDPGTLVASIPGALLSMTNTEVGTWRQRMGVIDSYRAHSLSLWARVFQSKGDFSPDHFNDGFGQGGNFDWNQKNTGMEAGIDFAVTDELSLGILAAQTEADVDLNDGVGNNEIDADTYGVYATWVSNGWYLDASYRWSDFESRLTSIAGPMEINADGETFNIETGYAWVTGSGLKIEPQLQYTHTKIEAIDVALGDLANMAMDDMDSSRGRLGLSFRKDFGDADSGWLFTPYSTLSVVREFDGEARYFITDDFTGFTSVEGTSAMLELGFNARTGNVAVYGGLTWQDGGAIDSFFGGHLGIRYTFGGAAPAPAPAPVVVQKTCAELDDDGDGVNNCDDKCPGSQAGQAIGPDGCPVPPAPEPEPVMEPKPYRG